MLAVGSALNSVGKFIMGRLVVAGSPLAALSCQFTHGLCLRAYCPSLQIMEPTEGKSSEYPTNVSPASTKLCPRLGVVKMCGQELSVIPWVDSENSAK